MVKHIRRIHLLSIYCWLETDIFSLWECTNNVHSLRSSHKNMHCYVYLNYYITKVMYLNLLCKLALLAIWYGKIQYHVNQACWVMNVTRHASQFISCTMMWNLGWAKFTEAPPTFTLAKNKKKVSIAFFSFCCRTSSRTLVKSVDIFRNIKKWNITEIYPIHLNM